MAVNGDERLNPLRAGFPVCDTVGGLNAAFAIMAALYHRERTGEGQFIDVALLDSIMPLMGWVAANLLIGKQQPVLHGQRQLHRRARRARSGPRTATSTSPPTSRSSGRRSADVLGVPELKTDPRFQERDTPQEEPQGADAAARGEADASSRRRHWVEVLNAKDVPTGEILSLEEALHQPQIQHRGTLQDVAVEGIGDAPALHLTAKFEKTPGAIERRRRACRRTPPRSWRAWA